MRRPIIESVVRKFRTTAADGKVYQVEYYNLDMIISLGYRVNSKQATKFRRWATNILKEYILKGYALDKERQQGIENRELSLQEAKGFVEIIGIYLFVLFLHKNGILYKPNGEARINDNALASLTLLVATSDPAQKEIIIKLIMNMLTEEVG